MPTIEIARDFSRTPGPRFARLGPNSGEAFRNKLIEALKVSQDDVVTVVLDGAEGYGSSFLEEAFGGLVRLGLFPAADLLHRLRITAHSRLYQTYAAEAQRYLEDAVRRSRRS